LNCEHFIYGSFNSSGYKLYASSGVKKILKPESLETLCGLQLKRIEKESTIQMHFPTEDVITFTKLTENSDTFGRLGVINKSIIIQVKEALVEYPEIIGILYRIIEEELNKPVTEAPKNMEQVTITK
jgi:hypothetical protein